MDSRPTEGTTQSSGPVLLACIQCRQKHLKCDAKIPVCGRCDKAKAQCLYKPSRRGYKDGPKRSRTDFEETESLGYEPFQENGAPTNIPIQPQWDLPASSCDSSAPSDTPGDCQTTEQIHNDWDALLSLDQMSPAPAKQDGHLINLYYTFFHPAHPILPPLHLLNGCNHIPPYLEAVIKFIGSHFTADVDSDTYRPLIDATLREAPNTFHKVQALLLFSIALHSRHERKEALESVTNAETLARELGLHHPSSARALGLRSQTQEESLRRTWWELYIVDGLFTAFDGKDSSGTGTVDDDMKLPGDELTYAEGRADHLAPTASQFFARAYADDEREFSSFCQRIDAIRILRRVLFLTRTGEANCKDRVDLIDASISSWFFLLPETKSEIIRVDGSVDEMLFQAYMIIHCASIFLHFPRSNLLSPSVAVAEILCAERGIVTLPASAHHCHALKAIKAADEISNLASLRIPNANHTPFFICVLAVSAIVQLSICSASATRSLDPRLDKVTLTISLLKSMNHTWTVSQQVLRQIRAVARGILENNSQPQPTIVSGDNDIDLQSIVDNNLWLGDMQFPI